jgi:hypothetical protein
MGSIDEFWLMEDHAVLLEYAEHGINKDKEEPGIFNRGVDNEEKLKSAAISGAAAIILVQDIGFSDSSKILPVIPEVISYYTEMISYYTKKVPKFSLNHHSKMLKKYGQTGNEPDDETTLKEAAASGAAAIIAVHRIKDQLTDHARVIIHYNELVKKIKTSGGGKKIKKTKRRNPKKSVRHRRHRMKSVRHRRHNKKSIRHRKKTLMSY